METFFLDINQLVVGSIVLNAAIMASFFGVSLSQRSALHRLEVALNEKNSLLAGTSVAGLLSSSMQEIEDAPDLEVTELLDTESDDVFPNIEIDRPVLSDSLDYDQVPSVSSISESQIMIFYWYGIYLGFQRNLSSVLSIKNILNYVLLIVSYWYNLFLSIVARQAG